MTQLFTKEQAPRRPAVKRMHVVSAGCAYWQVEFECSHCGYKSGFEEHSDKTLTELKRGLPCPKCNGETE